MRADAIGIAVVAACCGAIGCGGGASGEVGDLEVHVRYEGPLPAAERIDMSGDLLCLEQNPSGTITPALLEGADGALANAFVHVVEGVPDAARGPAPEGAPPAVVRFVGCGARAGVEDDARGSDGAVAVVIARLRRARARARARRGGRHSTFAPSLSR